MTADKMPRPIDPQVHIGHVHLKVADLERALRFYCGVLGFEITQRYGAGGVRLGRRLPPPHRVEHLGEPGRIAAAFGDHRPCTTPLSCTRPGVRSQTP